MPHYVTHSEAETHRLGRRLGGRLRAGDTVLLSGELGAGKSALARGIARGMGVEGAVPSPTFTLMAVHRGARCPLYHIDLYRLEDASDLYESGLEEYIGGDGVAVIEWPERAAGALPVRHLAVELCCIEDGLSRRIRLAARGGFSEHVFEDVPAELNGGEEA
ncbi:MAG: tRNA (adenosine(37)-N6)-threonylcarbamoyltransferase complex ATPase subunit type 1 TsaE [Clostridia bacterium]|nr:tRNA (adenosine(37)-N6)-threonylcarbamoyltransferase complex ATPase subunit type 1 TsaE [Clostridia bacterium]